MEGNRFSVCPVPVRTLLSASERSRGDTKIHLTYSYNSMALEKRSLSTGKSTVCYLTRSRQAGKRWGHTCFLVNIIKRRQFEDTIFFTAVWWVERWKTSIMLLTVTCQHPSLKVAVDFDTARREVREIVVSVSLMSTQCRYCDT